MKAKKILSRILSVLCALSFVFGIVIFVCALQAKQGKVPSVLGFSLMHISTGSMEPEYETGSIILTRAVGVQTLKKGDVISFYSTNSDILFTPNTHRIEEIKINDVGDYYIYTKGDANDDVDEDYVIESRIIGKVVLNMGAIGGNVFSLIRQRWFIMFFIIIPLIIITFIEALNLVNLIVDAREEKQAQKESEKGEQNDGEDGQ